jgi:hypothetical protein
MVHGTKLRATSGSVASVRRAIMIVAAVARSSSGYATYRRIMEPRLNLRDGSSMSWL